MSRIYIYYSRVYRSENQDHDVEQDVISLGDDGKFNS